MISSPMHLRHLSVDFGNVVHVLPFTLKRIIELSPQLKTLYMLCARSLSDRMHGGRLYKDGVFLTVLAGSCKELRRLDFCYKPWDDSYDVEREPCTIKNLLSSPSSGNINASSAPSVQTASLGVTYIIIDHRRMHAHRRDWRLSATTNSETLLRCCFSCSSRSVSGFQTRVLKQGIGDSSNATCQHTE